MQGNLRNNEPFGYAYPWTWGFCCCCPPCCWDLFFTSSACYVWTGIFVVIGIILLIVGQPFFIGLSFIAVGGFCFLYSYNILKSRENRIAQNGNPGLPHNVNPGYPADVPPNYGYPAQGP